ncbi:MAG: hypothetical protein KAG56_05775 [Sulfurovaceae bacterium]|nr:hypothetical protein [Sulfurovaceae bacterium]
MRIIITIYLLIFLIGCSSKVERVERQQTDELTTIRWSADDMQEIANKIVKDILTSPAITKGKTYGFGKIRNDSHDHIDTKQLANKIRTALIQSQKLNISQNQNSQNNKINELFFGKITTIFKKNSTTKDMYFNFNLILKNNLSNKLIWSKTVEIRKIYKKSLFGL